ncbi:hypothetical protein D8674_008384 [Pyrus ussuriensis x Pyrus communis]|uniref:Uncharacterized protein n=1 Tax=Pyrus ussuriensis x Pyrus communis TaxID=2448454 RepID=A0A5N5HSL7_9ROSA|nr:hypothetical protein D8674_008384 [Pyrus ussuriensis x Pyrus communis]
MADLGEGSRESKVQVPYFEDKSRADAYAKLRFDIGGLVRRECSVKFESWKKVLEELKKSMLGKLSVHWDVDETNEKQGKYLDDLFKKHFRQWKFDVLLPRRRRIEVELYFFFFMK